MVRTRTLTAGVLAVLVAACGGGGNGAIHTAERTATAGPFASSQKSAIDLDRTLPSRADVLRLMPSGFLKAFVITQSTAAPQGPLTARGVLAALDHGGVYEPAFESAGRGVGASVGFDVASPTPMHIEIIAVKFATQDAGQRFHNQISKVLTTVGGGKPEDLHIDPPPKEPIIDVPPSSLGYPIGENFVTDLFYPDGTYYLMSVAVPPGGVAGRFVVLTLADRQNSEYGLCVSYPKSCGPGPASG